MHPWIRLSSLPFVSFYFSWKRRRKKIPFIYFRPHSLYTRCKQLWNSLARSPHSLNFPQKKRIGKIKNSSQQAKKREQELWSRDIYRAKPQYNSKWLEYTIKNNKLSNEKGSCLKVWLETDFRVFALSLTMMLMCRRTLTNEIIFHERILFGFVCDGNIQI